MEMNESSPLALSRHVVALSQVELRKRSRIAGLWYLAMAIAGPLGILIIPSLLTVPGDAAATFSKITGSPGLWGLGIVAYILSQLVFFPLVLAFRSFLAQTDRGMARLMLAFVIASVPIALLALVGRMVPLILSGDPSFAAAFPPAQIHAISLLGLKLQTQGEIIAGFFWGLWLLPLGILVWRSGYFPKVFGLFLLGGCLSYLVDGVVAIAVPHIRPALSPFISTLATLGEVPFLLWLLIVGARTKRQAVAE